MLLEGRKASCCIDNWVGPTERQLPVDVFVWWTGWMRPIMVLLCAHTTPLWPLPLILQQVYVLYVVP